MIRIKSAQNRIVKEPLQVPFGFKGGYLTELCQSVCLFEDESGRSSAGLGVQSVLWSDPNVFALHGEKRGNELMKEITAFALNEAVDTSFSTPIELLERLLPSAYNRARELTSLKDLKPTFALNALVPIDHAAWLLYRNALALGNARYSDIVPPEYGSLLSCRHQALAGVPIVSYTMSDGEIEDLLREGNFVLKIKLGADPEQDNDPDKMLQWDMQRLSAVHRIAGAYATSYTDNGRIAYYLDANGRYPGKEYLLRFLDHADRIGALPSILLFEEPFLESCKADVSDVPVRVAADESIHDAESAQERISLGYGAIALKPVAKTLSLSLQIAKIALEQGIPCFCADLTANPLMVDWNKNLAARLPPIPGLSIGLLESNGPQNYRDWYRMRSRHPMSDASWIDIEDGVFRLNDDFYEYSGGVFENSSYYLELFHEREEAPGVCRGEKK